MTIFEALSSSRHSFSSSKKFKKNSGLLVHQEEPILGVSDLKFENFRNKAHPIDYHLQFCHTIWTLKLNFPNEIGVTAYSYMPDQLHLVHHKTKAVDITTGITLSSLKNHLSRSL